MATLIGMSSATPQLQFVATAIGVPIAESGAAGSLQLQAQLTPQFSFLLSPSPSSQLVQNAPSTGFEAVCLTNSGQFPAVVLFNSSPLGIPRPGISAGITLAPGQSALINFYDAPGVVPAAVYLNGYSVIGNTTIGVRFGFVQYVENFTAA